MHTRRSAIALGVSAVIASTAGCTARVPFLGDDPMEFGSATASVPQPVLDETGYEAQAIEEVVIEETFEAGGQRQDVVVTNWQAEFDKAIDLGDLGSVIDKRQEAAVFTALTTPQVNVFGRTFNPVADMSSQELADMVQDHYEELGDLEYVGEVSGTVAGESTTIGELSGEATLVAEGVSVDLTLHIAEAVESGDDLIVGIGGYPTELRQEEESNIFALMDAIEHGE